VAKKAKKTSRTLGEFLKDLAAISARAQEGDAEHGKAPGGEIAPDASVQDSLERIIISTQWSQEGPCFSVDNEIANARKYTGLGIAFALLNDPERRGMIAAQKPIADELLKVRAESRDADASFATRKGQLILRLRALGVERVEFSLSGGGDEGHIELENIQWAADPPAWAQNRPVSGLTDLPAPIKWSGFKDAEFSQIKNMLPKSHPHALFYYMIDVVNYLAGDGWKDGNGSSGSIILYPNISEKLEECIEKNMSDNEHDYNEDENEEFVDDEEFEESEELEMQKEPEMQNPSPHCASAIHPAPGPTDQETPFNGRVELSTSKNSWSLSLQLPPRSPGRDHAPVLKAR
jgi:hypothetical protein